MLLLAHVLVFCCVEKVGVRIQSLEHPVDGTLDGHLGGHLLHVLILNDTENLAKGFQPIVGAIRGSIQSGT